MYVPQGCIVTVLYQDRDAFTVSLESTWNCNEAKNQKGREGTCSSYDYVPNASLLPLVLVGSPAHLCLPTPVRGLPGSFPLPRLPTVQEQSKARFESSVPWAPGCLVPVCPP